MAGVVVGMSGGVDSAVACVLLKAAGYDVYGVTLKIWHDINRCCEVSEAAKTCETLGIPYSVVNMEAEFQRDVVDPFVEEYRAGRTPNPCCGCNHDIKWTGLMKAAAYHNAQFVATGHYARILKVPSGRLAVQTSEYADKDQSYMLYRLSQDMLARTIFPLGQLAKDEVRRIAKASGIEVYNKEESQEICFVPDGDYAAFIEDSLEGNVPPEGDFVDTEGNILGYHKGIINYTVGQRRGLGIALGERQYVTRIDPVNNVVVIGDDKDLFKREVICRSLNFMGIGDIPEGTGIRLCGKIRYHHPASPCTVTRTGEDEITAVFDEPVRAPAPGQSAVFYEGDLVALGGVIV
ncbi:MAG: tRNA 2-thiouridine(34) synthase MnmA [Clostridiales bacterium]|nr:tRNA 2-thiouridine(34) synthase MnmA [Clostridiales bacterium]